MDDDLKVLVDDLNVRACVMLELGKTPFDPELRKFSDVHWFIFYKAIKDREKSLKNMFLNILGTYLSEDKYVPFGYIVNSEVMKEVDRLRSVEEFKRERDDLKDLSSEELKFLIDDIEKSLKSVKDTLEKKEW